MERVLVILKPDAIQRRLIGRIIERFECKGLKIVGMKMLKVSKKQAEKLYAVHKSKKFYLTLVNFITSSPVVVMVLEGVQAIGVVRKLLGKTFALEAEPGTIRGDFGMSICHNLIHASDSLDSAKYEIPIFFKETELLKYELIDHNFVYNPDDLKQV